MSSEWSSVKREMRWIIRLLLFPLAVMWALQVVNTLTMGALLRFGVEPRTLIGLRGIVFAPLLHGGFIHLMANSVPWLVAGGLIVSSDVSELVIVTATSWVLGGLGAWLCGATGSVHVGCSGVVFGFFGFLLVSGWLKKSFFGIALSLLLGGTYGVVILLGALPTQSGISWQTHAFGLLGGVLAAFIIARRQARAARKLVGRAARAA